MPRQFTLKELVECAEREVSLRLREYPKLVAEKKMLPAMAEIEVAKMEQIKSALLQMQRTQSGYYDQTIPGNI